MRLALFGGSFDPPHRGHLALARAAADAFSLDHVYFTPVGRQPLKPDAAAATFAQRLAMTALLCAQDPRFLISEADAPRPDHQPNYTIDTLQTLAQSDPTATLYVLVGADSFHDLARWHQPEQLLTLAQWIVLSRPGYSLADPADLTLTPTQRTRIHTLDTLHLDISSTELRQRLATGDPCADLLTPAVAAYIQHHHLYRAA